MAAFIVFASCWRSNQLCMVVKSRVKYIESSWIKEIDTQGQEIIMCLGVAGRLAT